MPHRLRLALETFEGRNAEPLILRAAQELRASGESARRRLTTSALAAFALDCEPLPHYRPHTLEGNDVQGPLHLA